MGPRARILVVDDNAHARLWCRHLLVHDGYEVLEAGDGWTAIEIARTEHPDLVIQDLLLSDMDGFRLFEELRSLEGGESRPVIILSGWIAKIEEARRRGMPFAAYLLKPVAFDDLRRIIDQQVPYH